MNCHGDKFSSIQNIATLFTLGIYWEQEKLVYTFIDRKTTWET